MVSDKSRLKIRRIVEYILWNGIVLDWHQIKDIEGQGWKEAMVEIGCINSLYPKLKDHSQVQGHEDEHEDEHEAEEAEEILRKECLRIAESHQTQEIAFQTFQKKASDEGKYFGL